MTLGSAERPLRVAVIGAGPAGFFATAALFKAKDVHVRVDMFDMLPAPYGLVRYGVAPDHPEIKRVKKAYEKTAGDPRFRFFGNVKFGETLTHDEVMEHYDQVVYTHGAQSDRSLGIPGEELPGSYSATEFVAWYNGHPDYCERTFDLSCETAIVVGVGNVAMDAARILAKSVDELRPTDIADHALQALAESKIENVYVIGRRGPVQAKFTTPEIKEFGELEVADVIVDPAELELDPHSAAALEGDKVAQRNLEVLRGYAKQGATGKPRKAIFRFLTSPIRILGQDRVTAIELERNRIEVSESGYLNAVPTGDTEVLECGLVLRSVGYQGVPLPGVPCTRWGTVPHESGRVLDEEGNRVAREYVAGWAKRGPSGVIGTNKADAVETVNSMLSDVAATAPAADDKVAEGAIPALLGAKGAQYVSFEQWKRIDDFEVAAGEALGRVRVKVVSRDQMLRVSRGDS